MMDIKIKQLLLINTIVFGVVAVLHLWRALMGLELNIGSFALPVWASFLAFLVAGFLSYLNYNAQ